MHDRLLPIRDGREEKKTISNCEQPCICCDIPYEFPTTLTNHGDKEKKQETRWKQLEDWRKETDSMKKPTYVKQKSI